MRYRFHEFTIDTARREFRRAGELVALRPRVYALLVYLLEQRERAVSKSEVFARIWGRRIVTDATLSSCIKELRRALGDGSKTPRIVQTLHAHGFRFIAPVEIEVEQPSNDATRGEKTAIAAVSLTSESPVPISAAATDVREYKHVSVLVGAIPDAETHAARLGAEAMDEAMRHLLAHVHEIVGRYGGVVTEASSDGFVAMFGAPVAVEDHARRAVQVALELERYRLARSSSVPPISLGLHSGKALISRLADDAHRIYTAAGEVTSMARRLCAGASPGTPLATDSTYRLVADEIAAKPAIHVSGATAHGITSISVDRGGVPSHAARRSPFTGRSEELGLLHSRMSKALAGEGQLVCVVGEAGLGKSRLIDELQRFSASRENLEMAIVHCLAHHVTTPYMPIATLVRALCGCSARDTQEVVAQRVGEALRACGVDEPEALVFLLALLDVPGWDASVSRLSPETRRSRTFRYLTMYLVQRAASLPTVAVIEDLHWMDATSEAWLAELVARIDTTRLFVVATCRPGYRPPWPTSAAVTQLALPPLNATESRQLIGSMPRSRQLRDAEARRIVAIAQGNPFLLEELAWGLLDNDAAATSWALPATVESMVAARIDQLAGNDRQLLHIAAIFGTRVDMQLLAAVSGNPPAVLEASLGVLEKRGFMIEARSAVGRDYVFRHALTQDVAYHSLPAGVRSRAHHRIAEAMETNFPGMAAAQPEVLALHWAEAGRTDRAFAYWRRAGHRAIERSATLEAVAHLERALLANSELPRTSDTERERLEVLLMLGPALMATRGFAAREVDANYVEARELCAHAATDSQRFVAAWGYFLHNLHKGNIALARGLVGETLELARQIDEPGYWLQAHHAGWTFGITHGDLRESLEHAREGMRLYDPAVHQVQAHLYGMHDPGLCAVGSAADALWFFGEADTALALATREVEEARALMHPFSIVLALTDLMWIRCARREYAECAIQAREVIELCATGNSPNYSGYAGVMGGWSQVMLGVEDGLAVARASYSAYCSLGLERHRAFLLTLIVGCLLRMERYEEGLAALDEAHAAIERTGEVRWAAEVRRLRGVIEWRHRGNLAPAGKAMSEALSLAHTHGARMLELRAATSLAQLWMARGEPQKGLALLRPALEPITEGLDTPDLRDAAETLAACQRA